MTITDWLWILHPALAVVLIYPLIGMVVRLAWQTRQRRVAQVKHPPVVGRDHSDLGRWLAAGVVLLVLIALTVAIATKAPPADFSGGAGRAIQLSIVLLGTGASWSVRSTQRPVAGALHELKEMKQGCSLRLSFSLITWIGVLTLGAQPEVWRLSDDPLSPAFWQSHDWAGVAVTGLMLFSSRPGLRRKSGTFACAGCMSKITVWHPMLLRCRASPARWMLEIGAAGKNLVCGL